LKTGDFNHNRWILGVSAANRKFIAGQKSCSGRLPLISAIPFMDNFWLADGIEIYAAIFSRFF
jgi:hypothetical protein